MGMRAEQGDARLAGQVLAAPRPEDGVPLAVGDTNSLMFSITPATRR